MKQTFFAPAAQAELEGAAEWYESRVEGLGQRLVLAVDVAIGRIAQSPAACPVWETDQRFRRLILQRFPYLIFYRELPDCIEVVAVAHGAREPGYWLGRK